MKAGRGRCGSVLVEGVASVLVASLSVGLQLELTRRAQQETVLHHVAFLTARSRALGADWAQTRKRLLAFVGRPTLAGRFGTLDLSDSAQRQQLTAKVHLRFASLWAFPLGSASKHHFEVTRRCCFPWSY